MNQTTVKQLSNLNNDFYQKTAKFFDQSRQHPWSGWEKVWNLISENGDELRVIDLGCGNGRFLKFLQTKMTESKAELKYTGLDNNGYFLDLARQNFPTKHQFAQFDLIKFLLGEKNEQAELDSQTKFDLVFSAGLIHHLPSFKLRKKFVEWCSELCLRGGLVVVTTWQFTNHPKFDQKTVNPTKLNIDPAELEKNDFILDWQRGVTAFRYCHLVDDQEFAKLIEDSQLKLINTFLADGRNNQLNKYFVLKKN